MLLLRKITATGYLQSCFTSFFRSILQRSDNCTHTICHTKFNVFIQRKF
jgi:hypothetical protein